MNQVAKIGDNMPPANTPEGLQENIRIIHADTLGHAQNLVDAAQRIPQEITDAETAGKCADYIKKVSSCQKKVEALRVGEKEPYLTLGRVVDGFFKNISDPLEAARRTAMKPLDAFNKRAADEERRRRDEETRQAREKAQEEARIAQALERANQVAPAAEMIDRAAASAVVADKLAKEADAKPAHLAHVRGESGARAALRTWWVGEVNSLEVIDLEVLRHHLNPDAVQKAVNSFVAAGGRVLKGATIYEKSETVVR